MPIQYLMYEKTSPGEGTANTAPGPNKKSIQAIVHGDGAVSAEVKVSVSNNEEDWIELGVITINGTDMASDGFGHETPWKAYRADLVSITGTDAKAWCTVYE